METSTLLSNRHETIVTPSESLAPEMGFVAIVHSNEPEVSGSWQDDALCVQTDPEAFYPEKGMSTRDAKKVCAQCDVRERCLQYALDNDERFGVWGGLSERERRRHRRKNAS